MLIKKVYLMRYLSAIALYYYTPGEVISEKNPRYLSEEKLRASLLTERVISRKSTFIDIFTMRSCIMSYDLDHIFYGWFNCLI